MKWITMAKLLILLTSNFGYYNFLRKRTHLNICCIPLVTIGIQISALLAAGILNLLMPAALLMLAGGIILLFLDFTRKEFHAYKKFRDVSYVYAGICLVILFLCLNGSEFFHFDDFSHWGTAARELLGSNRFPNDTNRMIIFQTYPLGSTVYVYYCCLLAGTEESTMMFIQSFVMICAIMPLFGCISDHKLGPCVFVLIFTNFVLTYNAHISSLMVDTLLPLFGMGTLLITWEICSGEQLPEGKKERSDIWSIAPLMITIVMIKNAGIFFILPSAALIIAFWTRNRERKYACAAVLLAPAAAMLLWQIHCKIVYSAAAMSKHSVSFARYGEEFRTKSLDFIGQLGAEILKFLFLHPAFWCILLLIAAMIGMDCLTSTGHMKKTLKFAAWVIGAYLLYMAGLYGMYIFSMPIHEAKGLDSIARYVCTIDIAAFYMIAAYGLKQMGKSHYKRRFIAAFLTFVLLWGYLTNWAVVSGVKNPQPRQWFEEQIENYQIPLGSPCVICCSNDPADGYLRNILSYLLWTPYIFGEDHFKQKNRTDMDEIQYIIMYDYEDEEMNHWIQKHYPNQFGNAVIVRN